ncbi:uncharacterized protein LOC126252954 [Schistocerca nitens]|uniref:uncharacterized protein LOC126252954 n=1 Tax=Schistocerca nitens TaxID=7011 RepID=UPI00211879C4|nr:uncharacterized protein LOC126252954 [Schistocerca nitens]
MHGQKIMFKNVDSTKKPRFSTLQPDVWSCDHSKGTSRLRFSTSHTLASSQPYEELVASQEVDLELKKLLMGHTTEMQLQQISMPGRRVILWCIMSRQKPHHTLHNNYPKRSI